MAVISLTYDYRPEEKYRFLLTHNYTLEITTVYGNFKFYQGKKKLAQISGSRLTIFAPFAWDGCSPSQFLGIQKLSAPTPPSMVEPSLVHDLFYQFMKVRDCPWDKAWADQEFLRLARQNEFKYAWLYWVAVKAFGWASLKTKDVNSKNLKII